MLNLELVTASFFNIFLVPSEWSKTCNSFPASYCTDLFALNFAFLEKIYGVHVNANACCYKMKGHLVQVWNDALVNFLKHKVAAAWTYLISTFQWDANRVKDMLDERWKISAADSDKNMGVAQYTVSTESLYFQFSMICWQKWKLPLGCTQGWKPVDIFCM